MPWYELPEGPAGEPEAAVVPQNLTPELVQWLQQALISVMKCPQAKLDPRLWAVLKAALLASEELEKSI